MNISAKQLRTAAKIKGQIERLQNKMNKIFGASPEIAEVKTRRKMSPAARAKIAKAAKARWARYRAAKGK